MADIRIKDLATTASSAASDDFMALDGVTNGTRKMSAANPSVTTLTTSGVIAPGGSVHGANGTAANPSFAFNSDQNTGLYRIGADNIGVAANGAKVLDIATTGLTVTGAVTATTTLADQGGTIAAQRNGLAPAQGLVFNGTTGTTVANVPAFGTADFTLAFWSNQTSLSDYQCVLGGNVNAIEVSINGSGNLRVRNPGIAERGTASTALGTGVINFVTLARASGVYTVRVNGITVANAIVDDTYSVATTNIGSNYFAGYYFLGTLRVLIFNRALSAAEVLALYQTGAVASADYNTASNTALSLGNFANVGYETFTGASTTGFTAINTSVDGYAYTTNQFTLIQGARYRMTFTCTLTSGQVPVAYLGVPGSSVLSAQTRIAAGSNVLEFTATASGAANGVFYSFNGEAVSYAISNFALTRIGALLAPDSNNAGAGLEWLDVSGNRAHIILPTSGVSWSLPSSQQIVIEASTSTNGNQQLGGASLIDANKQWRIQSWTVNCSTGTPTISLGNVSAGTQYNAVAVLAAGNNDITLVTRFPSTANLWVNSSTTATLIHRITLVPAN